MTKSSSQSNIHRQLCSSQADFRLTLLMISEKLIVLSLSIRVKVAVTNMQTTELKVDGLTGRYRPALARLSA